MLERLIMHSSGGTVSAVDLADVSEFVQPESSVEDTSRIWADFSKPRTFECSFDISYMSMRSIKWWECMKLYGNWTAKGPIRMRMLRKAAMQAKRRIRAYRVYKDTDGRYLLKRGDGMTVEIILDKSAEEVV